MHTTHPILAAALLASSSASQIPRVPTVTCDHCDRIIGTGSIRYAIGRCACGASLAALAVERPTCGGCGAVWEDDAAPAPRYCDPCEDERAQAARENAA